MGKTEEGGNVCLVVNPALEMTTISSGTAFSLLILEADKLFISLLGPLAQAQLVPIVSERLADKVFVITFSKITALIN